MNYLFIFPLLGLALGQGSPTGLGNLVETLKTSSLQSILVDLIDAAGLTEALSQGGERFFKISFIINFGHFFSFTALCEEKKLRKILKINEL